MSSMIENFDSLARLSLEALLNTLWQGTLIAVLVWLLLRLVNRASATTRHAVWLVTLLTIGALPFLAVLANRVANEVGIGPDRKPSLAGFCLTTLGPLGPLEHQNFAGLQCSLERNRRFSRSRHGSLQAISVARRVKSQLTFG